MIRATAVAATPALVTVPLTVVAIPVTQVNDQINRVQRVTRELRSYRSGRPLSSPPSE
jgi:hypothetical protein